MADEYFYKLRDSYGRPTSVTVEALGAGAVADCQATGALLDAASQLRVEAIGQIKRSGAVATPATPTVDSINSKYVVFRMLAIGADGNQVEVEQQMPELKDTYMSGSDVNIAHADVVAFWQQYVSATGILCVKDGGYVVDAGAGAPALLGGYRL